MLYPAPRAARAEANTEDYFVYILARRSHVSRGFQQYS